VKLQKWLVRKESVINLTLENIIVFVTLKEDSLYIVELIKIN